MAEAAAAAAARATANPERRRREAVLRRAPLLLRLLHILRLLLLTIHLLLGLPVLGLLGLPILRLLGLLAVCSMLLRRRRGLPVLLVLLLRWERVRLPCGLLRRRRAAPACTRSEKRLRKAALPRQCVFPARLPQGRSWEEVTKQILEPR